ncbi:unnamed protein product [Bursaphelenchus okinawaensis]|uniref:UBX domain-containing protein n=1 Tax=Bursaphelenchus okinawaensis TaxID=465554 RepID=A0A811LMR2_9BILA|nr:unnamed protein product [Bursaphelenchus okinawaensis]CAG9126533.1 unnamed protein product [Bursaphelenchus okinawaensis]
MSHAAVLQFKEFTGVSDDTIADQMLGCCDGDVGRAVELYFARQQVVESVRNGQQDDDVQVIEREEHMEEAVPVSSNAVEVADDDGVRAPMRPVSGRLVQGSFDEQYGSRRRRAAHPIFEQDHDEAGSSGMYRYNGESNENEPARKKRRDLKDLFRPPVELIARFNWDSLLQVGQQKSRWILVNLQEPTEFASQVLNRDVWSNSTVKELIKVNFLFWQMYCDSSEGRRIATYYNITQFPAVFVVDPRIGEMVQSISATDPDAMIHILSDFTEKYPTFKARDLAIKRDMAQNKTDFIDPKLRTPQAMKNGQSASTSAEPSTSKRQSSSDIANAQAKRMKKVVVIDSSEESDDEVKPLTPPSSDSSTCAISFQPWQSYVREDSEGSVDVILRMPDSSREPLKLTLKTPLEALFAFISEKDLDVTQHGLILTFPRRVFKVENAKETLGQLGFQRQELIHVERL